MKGLASARPFFICGCESETIRPSLIRPGRRPYLFTLRQSTIASEENFPAYGRIENRVRMSIVQPLNLHEPTAMQPSI
jgi:hypothetical protein